MADYTETTWIENVTKVGPTRMNALEAGVKDAAEHNKSGLSSDRPPASAANKNWIWVDEDTARSWYSDGVSWLPMGGGSGEGAALSVVNAVAAASGLLISSSYTAQRFTAERSGKLGMLEVRLKRDAAMSQKGTLNVFIYGANPDGTIAGLIGYYGQIRVSDIGTAYGAFKLRQAMDADTVTVVDGNRYFVVLRAVQTGPLGVLNTGIYWQQSNAGGEQYVAESTDGSAWGTQVNSLALQAWLMTPGSDLTSDGVADLLHLRDANGTPNAWVDKDGRPGGLLDRPFVTGLPATPYDGQEVSFLPDPDSAVNAAVAWLLKYRAADAKWYFLGGPPMIAQSNTGVSLSPTGWTESDGLGGARLTAPLTGDYTVRFGNVGGPNAGAHYEYGIRVGATDPAHATGLQIGTIFCSSANLRDSYEQEGRALAVPAGTILRHVVMADGPGTVEFPWLAITPRRVS